MAAAAGAALGRAALEHLRAGSTDPGDPSLVRHHLLLADVATRRDLADPATAQAVAGAVGDVAMERGPGG